MHTLYRTVPYLYAEVDFLLWIFLFGYFIVGYFIVSQDHGCKLQSTKIKVFNALKPIVLTV